MSDEAERMQNIALNMFRVGMNTVEIARHLKLREGGCLRTSIRSKTISEISRCSRTKGEGLRMICEGISKCPHCAVKFSFRRGWQRRRWEALSWAQAHVEKDPTVREITKLADDVLERRQSRRGRT